MNRTFDNVVRTVAVLNAKTGDASNVGPNTATLEGSLNPDGMPTTYKFQYGLDKKQYDIETEAQSAGSGTSDIAVKPIDIDKLQPGRTYHYRLVAENELGRTNAEDRTFTAPARPLISSLNPTNILGESVDLTGHINNFNLDSTYHFDYGTTAAYGQSTPERELSAGTTPQFVVEHVTELQPGSTYHFRLVATNQFGTSYSTDATFDYAPPGCPNSHVRQQTGANYLPDCRAYELVSPSRAGSIQFFPGDFFYRLGNRDLRPGIGTAVSEHGLRVLTSAVRLLRRARRSDGGRISELPLRSISGDPNRPRLGDPLRGTERRRNRRIAPRAVQRDAGQMHRLQSQLLV